MISYNIPARWSCKVLIAPLLQLCGHIPGVIYGIYVVTRE